MTTSLTPARLRPADVARVGAAGLRARPGRVLLSALGIAIGIATMISVIGISASGQQRLLRQLDRLGTNLLRVQPGQTITGEDAKMPVRTLPMVQRIDAVTTASATGDTEATIRRNDRIPAEQTGGITVEATSLDLLRTLNGRVGTGTWLNPATARYPTIVLGSVAARRLAITHPGTQVWITNRWFTVTGVLRPIPLAPEIDRAALTGFPAAQAYLGFDAHPTTIYERSRQDSVPAVRDVLPRSINPEHPEEITVSRPSDALSARAAAAGTFTGLLLGLGTVALLVGAVGVANTMIISVLERRQEIGLRRSLGATRPQIRTQFLAESLLLSSLGALTGLLIGALITTTYALSQSWPPTLPPWTLAAAPSATLLIGLTAGLYPAIRASHLPPTTALKST